MYAAVLILLPYPVLLFSFLYLHSFILFPIDEEVAVKIEQKKNPNPQLLFESKLYSVFQGGVGIPKMYWFGVEGSYNVLVMELLGPNLEDMFNYCCRKFSLKTVLMLAQEMITRLEFVHSRNFIHRDIKPENFLVGSKVRPNLLYVIDFGLSKKYCNPLTKQHIKYVCLFVVINS